MGKPSLVKEIEYQVEVNRKKTRSAALLSKVNLILSNNPDIFISLGFSKWGLVEWNLCTFSIKTPTQLVCQILSEDEKAWLTIQQLYIEAKSRGWREPLTVMQRALDREVTKQNRKIRREELYGFNIQLYGLSSREWNRENILNLLLAD